MERTQLLHILPSFNVGGREMRFAQIANHFKNEYHHLILALDGQVACEKLLESGVSYEILPVCESRGGLLSRLKYFRSLIKRYAPDKLITYNWGAIEWTLAHWGLSVEHIHIEDGFGPEEKHQQISRRVWFRRISLKCASSVVVPSRTLEKIASDFWKVPKRKLKFIANGVDLELLSKPDMTRYQHFFPNSKAVKLGTIARLRKEKNIPRLISVFESICNEYPIELWIAGDGPEYTSIQSRVNSSFAKHKIHLIGNVDHPADYMNHLDLFVLSSDTEQMPYSVLEAGGASKPVASVDVGDIRSLVAKSNRPYVQGTEENHLKDSIVQLVSDDSLRTQLGMDNRGYCQNHFGIDVMLKQYHQLFSKVAPNL